MPNSSVVKLGLVGCGRIAQAAHLPAIAKAQNVRLCGVCDESVTLSQQMARRYDVQPYLKLTDLLDADIDAVILAVPDRMHVPLAFAAIQSGKHILVEKPIATSAREAETLAAALSSSGIKLQVGNVKRFDPGIQFAAAVIRSGRIGKILTVSSWYRVMSALRQPIEATLFPALVVDQNIRDREVSLKQTNRENHLLFTHGVHTFDLLRFLAGDFRICYAERAVVKTDYSWHVIARLETGGLVSCELTTNIHAEWSEGIDIYGSLGHMGIRLPFAFFRKAGSVRLFEESSSTYIVPVFGDTDPYKRQIEAFADAILNQRNTSPDIEDGISALRTLETVQALTERSTQA